MKNLKFIQFSRKFRTHDTKLIENIDRCKSLRYYIELFLRTCLRSTCMSYRSFQTQLKSLPH